jgi:hypothetical protein
MRIDTTSVGILPDESLPVRIDRRRDGRHDRLRRLGLERPQRRAMSQGPAGAFRAPAADLTWWCPIWHDAFMFESSFKTALRYVAT